LKKLCSQGPIAVGAARTVSASQHWFYKEFLMLDFPLFVLIISNDHAKIKSGGS
jgi:hypothetical protein